MTKNNGKMDAPNIPKGDNSKKENTDEVLRKLLDSQYEAIKNQQKTNMLLEKLTKSSQKQVSEQKKENNSKEQKKQEENALRADAKRNTQIRALMSIQNSLQRMENISFGLRGTKKDLTGRTKELLKEALGGKDVSKQLTQLQYDKFNLEIDQNKREQSMLGLMSKAMSNSVKLNGGAALATGLITGINPVIAQALGLDKAAKWLGGKALNGLSNLTGSAKNLLTSKKETNEPEEGTPSRGTGKLKSKDEVAMDETRKNVEGIYGLLKNKKEKTEEKEEKEEGGILSTIMAAAGTLLSLAAPAAGALLALAGKNIVSSIVEKFLTGLGMGKEAAAGVGDFISDILPGAILGFKLGGVKGAFVGALISKAYFAIKDQVGSITDLINGKVDPEVGDLKSLGKDVLDGAIAGGALGTPFGPPGILAGALIGATSGAFVNLWKQFKNEENRKQEQEKKDKEVLQEAAAKGITYSAKQANESQVIQNQNLQTFIEKNPNDPNAKVAKKILEERKKDSKKLSKYEKERQKVQVDALKKYGTSDLSKLNLDQLEDLMDDDDAEFEYFMYDLQRQGNIVNDEETRKVLRKAWTDNENWTWGENKDSKRAVMRVVSEMVSKEMPTEGQILSDSSTQRSIDTMEKTSDKIVDTQKQTADKLGGGTTITTMSVDSTNVNKDTPSGMGR